MKSMLTIIKNACNQIWKYLNNKYVIYSFVSSILLIILSYFYNNLPLFTGESMFRYYWTQRICDYIGIHKTVDYGDAVFYNMSYDKKLIPAVNRYDTLGVECVTDREKLLNFLDLLQQTDKYKYVIVDFIFDKSLKSEVDKELFSKISNMRDIIVANHVHIDNGAKELENKGKTGLVTYFITSVATNFGRMEYSLDTVYNKKSLPLVVYENLHPNNKLKRFGLGRFSIYTMGNRLCQNSNFLTFDSTYVKPVNYEHNNYFFSSKYYTNVGKLFNDYEDSYEELKEMMNKNTEGKYVVIGDFHSDIHDTYVGELPGSVIMMRGIASLEEGANIVSFSQNLMWFIVFFLISLTILNNKPISKSLPYIKKIPNKLFHFAFSLVSFGFTLFVVSFIEYILGYQIYSLVIPILYFSLLKINVQYIRQNSYE